MHFFEALEHEIDFQIEFNKLEDMVVKERVGKSYYQNGITIDEYIEKHFRKWEKRGSFTSFKELREHLGFGYNIVARNFIYAYPIDINKFFLYCEMILNLLIGLPNDPYIEEQIQDLLATMNATIEKTGHTVERVKDEIQIIKKDIVAISVVDNQPELANIIIEYNHYLLKGNIGRKREILKQIADALEPKRTELNGINKHATDDFFSMVNNLNVRHNNCDPADAKRYREGFARLSDNEKEKWYDTIYQQGLTLFVLLEQKNRNKIIDAFRENLKL